MKEEKYLEMLPEDMQQQYKEGTALLEIGDLEQAEEIFGEINSNYPDFIPADNKLAVISIYNKDLDRAADLLYRILKQDEEFAPAITNLGSIEREKGNQQQALKFYQQAINIDPDYGPAYNNLGVVYRELGDYSQSIKYLKKAKKMGSYSMKTSDAPFYKQPGCLVPIIIFAIIFGLIYLLLR